MWNRSSSSAHKYRRVQDVLEIVALDFFDEGLDFVLVELF